LPFLVVAIAVILAIVLFRDRIQRWTFDRGILANDAPAPELLEEYLRKAPDPGGAILAAWNSGRIVHRHFAVRALALPSVVPALTAELESVLLVGALDADLNVREAALSGLRARQHSELTTMAAAQLSDPDPHVRLLGIDYLKSAPAERGLPLVARALDDQDPRVTARAIKLMGEWAGEDFGMHLVDTVEVADPATGLKGFREEGLARTKAAGERGREWWRQHEADYPLEKTAVPPAVLAEVKPIPAGDFRLPTLEGRPVRLSDFRGKTVIINFWATWCTACLTEIPELVALQSRHGDRLVILGVSLDGASHVHANGPEADAADHDGHGHGGGSEATRALVSRMAKKLGINYTVLLDERNHVGARFNGGELPTTVIVDSEGNVRRRFVGARSLAMFEAMLEEVLSLRETLRELPNGSPLWGGSPIPTR
jgi:thiol-disulfide isomerase/thioredoxin